MSDLSNKERSLKEEIRQLMTTKLKAYQSIKRKEARISRLQKIAESIRTLPDSDGEEQMTKIIQEIERNEVLKEKYILIDEHSNTRVTVTRVPVQESGQI